MTGTMRKISTAALVAIFGAMLCAQFIPIQRTNPSIKGDVVAPPEVKTLLGRACYDCHSNETRWPWYTHVAPVSWWVERDVERGRQQLNFSQWGTYYPNTKRRKLQWVDRALREESMPPWSYRILHPGAGLTKEELIALEKWIESAISDQPREQTEPKEDS